MTIADLQNFVTLTKLHPILVNFTAALVPVSVACDAASLYRKEKSLQNTAWWTLLFAVLITPFTALTGWLFWMKDDNGVSGMAVHRWLGTALVFLLGGLFLWRRSIHRRGGWASPGYLAAGLVTVILLGIQGHLGGTQTYSGM
jgi:uncharacterized membrane protein